MTLANNHSHQIDFAEASNLLNRRQILQAMLGTGALAAIEHAKGAFAGAPKKKIRIAQIGTGHGHATKVSVYRESPDYEVVGISEPNAELRRRAESVKAYQGLPWLSVDELLAIDDLDAVLIETHVRDLLNMAELCVERGKHIHLDKPAGARLPQFNRILDTARRQKLVVQLGYMYRYNPGFLLLRQFLSEGWLGEIFEIDAVMSKVLDPASRLELAEFSGGTMFELGCHLIDMVVALMGKPQSITSILQHSGQFDDSLNDNCLAIFTWPRANAVIRSSGVEIDGGRRRHFVVCGTEGTFEFRPLDNPQVTVSFSKARGPYKAGTQTITLPKFSRYVADADDMARIIRGEKSSDFPLEHELLVQTVMLEAAGMPLK